MRGFDYDGVSVRANGVSFDAFPAPAYGGVVAAGDVDADGLADMVAARGPGPALDETVRGFHLVSGRVAALPGYEVNPFFCLFGARTGLAASDVVGRSYLLVGAGPDPAATTAVATYRYTGSSLVPPCFFYIPFGSAMYGVNVGGAALLY